ncbi:MAG: indole-3-glycerol phosphate synthase TrpC [Saprospiraceae bacterium]|nr:indole-3-glycerol phosphate synthase TrpC [Saprospiraceae bacterium]
MSILQEIIDSKRKEITLRKAAVGIRTLEKSPHFSKQPRSLSRRLQQTPGIIAEFKRRSPSKGLIRAGANPEAIASAYADAGAAAISVLTDEPYFGGNNRDLELIREVVDIPLLRKEFIIDEYQIVEAKALGADLILLIAAALSVKEVKTLAGVAHNLGLEVLLELHDETELDHIAPEVGLLGVNNRNLNTFETTLQTSFMLAKQLPGDRVWVAESGLHHPENLVELSLTGYCGFLIGEAFMKAENPGAECARFVQAIQPIL